MNYKQKLGYMALGAGILAIGIIIGQIITPDIEAQSNGVFDEITCRNITVIDHLGKDAITLNSDDVVNGMVIYNTAGEPGFVLSASKAGNGVEVFDTAGRLAFRLSSTRITNSVSIVGKTGKGPVFNLTTSQAGSTIMISDTAGNIVEGFEVD